MVSPHTDFDPLQNYCARSLGYGWTEELPDMQKRYQRWAKHLDLIERCRILIRLGSESLCTYLRMLLLMVIQSGRMTAGYWGGLSGTRELSSSEIFEDVPAIFESAPDTSYSAKQCSTSNDQSFESEDLPKEQEQTLKKTLFCRQIVPPKRLDITSTLTSVHFI
ncbi:hypothetical protein NPIL_467111 [Nephila pilipes]|uniref:Uncharacterized protein n=1 Tax=Nephila pilipes TaxID=299642 RepID=A0A8X6MGJ5_NEPPI|nr:hypothetical protein NPIL_467111 [Nephila pilipes]